MVAEFMMGHRSQLDPNEYDKAIREYSGCLGVLGIKKIFIYYSF